MRERLEHASVNVNLGNEQRQPTGKERENKERPID